MPYRELPPTRRVFHRAWLLAWAGFGALALFAAFGGGYFAGTRAESPIAQANADRSACITNLRSDLDLARVRKQNAVDRRDNIATELTLVEAQALATPRTGPDADPEHFAALVKLGLAVSDQVNTAQREVDARQPAVDRALRRIERLNGLCPPVA